MFGSQLFVFPTDSLGDLTAYIRRANQDDHINDIQDIFILPSKVFDNVTLITSSFDYNNVSHPLYRVPNDSNPYVEEVSYNKIHSFTGFTPKNNKLYCYPYNYIYATNNIGDNAIYKFEEFSDNKCNFYNFFGISVGGSGRLVPRNYKGFLENNDESITLAKLPTCQWSSDSYTNWLTQNAVNFETRNINTAIGMLGSAASGNVAGVATSLANTYLQYKNDFYSASLLPQKVAGTNGGDVNFSSNNVCYKLVRMHPKLEYLRMIDDWFTRFGYKIERLKTPNITGRRNFNYVEIGQSDEMLVGNVPFKFMEELNNTCRKGVTIWHNHANIGNYNVQNDIL